MAVIDGDVLVYMAIWKSETIEEGKKLIKKYDGEFPKNYFSEIMKYCYSIKQEVIVHGGLTNLVGGTETESNQLVISLDKMNLIEEVDPQSKTITAQAGTILENMIDAAKEKNLLLPMSFGAKGSAHIGGVVSTNAGGLRVFRYGMTRQMVLGLEVVLPDGTIISSLKKIIKDKMIVVLGVKFGKIFQILILHIIQHMVGLPHQKI